MSGISFSGILAVVFLLGVYFKMAAGEFRISTTPKLNNWIRAEAESELFITE